jgi:small-conductance mechanosensitive channel
MLVSRLDALWFGRDTKELAEDYRDKIVQAIVQEKKENSLASWTKRILLVLLILAGSALLVTAITRLFNWLLKHVLRLSDTLFSRRIWFVPKQFQKQIVLRGIQTIRWAITLLALYMCLPLLFYVFPDTKDITDTLLNWIISPAKDIARGVLAFLPNLFTIIIVYLTIRFTIKGFGFFFGEIEKGQLNVKGFHSDFAKPTFNIVRFILYAFMLVVIFPYLPGSGSPAFQGVSVFLGILFSLGSSSAINNAIAGLVITYMRPFKIGDRVKIAETVGDVVEKSMLVIKIRSLKNEEITIPNSTVLSSSTINFSTNSSDPGLIIHSTVTIGYDTPWRNMHAALIKAASTTPGILPKPEPFVLQTSLDDFYVSYQVNAYTNEPNNQLAIYSLLHQNIQDCCTEAGIEIMSPHYRSVRDGSESTIPK